MEDWRKNRTRGAWSLAWVFAVVFHQLLPPLLEGQAFDQQAFVFFTLYFGAITFLFTWLFLFLPAWLVAAMLFVFGAFVEAFLFGVIASPLWAGIFYIAMFLVPRWASQQIWKPVDGEAEASK